MTSIKRFRDQTENSTRIYQFQCSNIDAGAELTRCAGFVLTRVRAMNALVGR